MQQWTALAALGFLPNDTVITPPPTSVAPPQPVTLTITSLGGNVSIRFGSQSGYRYTLEATANLHPASWSPAAGALPSHSQTGTGGDLAFSVPAAGANYYRVSAR